MNETARREDVVATDRVQNKPDHLGGHLILEEVGFERQTRPQDPVRADVIVPSTCDTFSDGAGI
jgi:hypothetical protein